MKKLLLSATTALLAVGGVYAACETPGTPATSNVADVYDFRATVRTIANKNTNTSFKDECGTVIVGGCCYRVTTTRQFKGVFIACDCVSFKPGEAFFYVGTSETKYKYVDDNISGGGDASYVFPILNIYGNCSASRSQYIQGLLSLTFLDSTGIQADLTTEITKTYTLQAAGFGTQKNAKVYSMSGYITGSVSTTPCNCTDAFELAFAPCDLSDLSTEANAVGGIWTLKYNSSLSKFAATNGGETGLAVAQKVFGTSGVSYQTTSN